MGRELEEIRGVLEVTFGVGNLQMGISRLQSWTKRIRGSGVIPSPNDKKLPMVRVPGPRFWVSGGLLCLTNVPHTCTCRTQGKASPIVPRKWDKAPTVSAGALLVEMLARYTTAPEQH